MDSTPSSSRQRLRTLADLCRRLLVSDEPRQRRWLATLTIALVVGIGVVDFFVGFEVSLLVFYCVPVVMAVTALGWPYGILVSFASVTSWVAGDIAAGASYATRGVLWWNAVIALAIYLVVVWLFHIVRTLVREMEARVQDRTAALTAEIRERERLEKAVLEITERERLRIGHDLHDGLGQHLTGTAFAGQVLGEKLRARALAEEEADAWQVVRLVEDAIEKTRQLANGLLLAEIEREGLVTALQQLANTTAAQFRVTCTFRSTGPCDVGPSGAATHLLRIAQEAVRNAVRHGKARVIEIQLKGGTDFLELTIHDRGTGLPPPDRRRDGLGLRIMAHRARMIGGQFSVAAAPDGGTVVRCRVPRAPTP